MSLGTEIAQREATDRGELIFHNNRLITTQQLAVLIIKPSNTICNANNGAQISIASLVALKKKDGSYKP